MDTYKRSIRGLQSRSNGEHFEGMIIAASRFYEERGIAAVDKTPEAFKSFNDIFTVIVQAFTKHFCPFFVFSFLDHFSSSKDITLHTLIL